ncbi:MAG: HU family DNA-binding protein [Ruminococcaceae bacterium]|nr:HU family DNA-binding protein [Oscillospiraceae bacterium]
MTKSDLIERVAEETGMSRKSVGAVCNALFNQMSERLMNGETVQISGFGKFTVKTRPAHVGKNPQNGEEIRVSESRGIVFSVGKTLKEKMNET